MADAPPTDSPPQHLSRRAIRDLPVAMVIADPWQPDCPIIYVNRAFTKITGYTEEMAVGRNCRFLQGPDTDPDTCLAIRSAIARAEDISVDILNYRADGSPFINHLMIAPLFDESGALTHFLGVQAVHNAAEDDSRRVQELGERLRQLQRRVRTHLSMIFSLIRLQARQGDPSLVVKVLASRVQAISLLYDDFVLPGVE
ncbi:MAG: PAS domain-containing protein [Pseudomonadota bacterium]